MLLHELAGRGYSVPRQLSSADFDLFHGDFVALGRGEVLLAS
jgi:hypothetical protein